MYSGGLVAFLRELLIAFASLAPKTISVLYSRLAKMPTVRDPLGRGLKYRSFKKGLEYGRWTGDDHVALLQQLIYVVGTGTAVIPARTSVRKSYIK